MRSGNWIERGSEIGKYFLEELKRLQEKYNVVKEARGKGLLLALEFHPHEHISVERVYGLLLEKGFLVGYYPAGNILRFDQSLTIEKNDVIHLLECLNSILETVG
jgi:4-aminobutyrate aminotransferase-like enzyme